MTKLTSPVLAELLAAMDLYSATAHRLIQKVLRETEQPQQARLAQGHYYELENAALLNGQQTLSDNWCFDVHGEHCLFTHAPSGQTLEVSLGNPDSVGNLDPYFFYHFLQTTPGLQHLTAYFDHPFSGMLALFEELTAQGVLIQVQGVEYRKRA